MEGEKRSFKDKMKFFEQEIAEQKTVKPRANGTYQNYFVFWRVNERAVTISSEMLGQESRESLAILLPCTGCTHLLDRTKY